MHFLENIKEAILIQLRRFLYVAMKANENYVKVLQFYWRSLFLLFGSKQVGEMRPPYRFRRQELYPGLV